MDCGACVVPMEQDGYEFCCPKCGITCADGSTIDNGGQRDIGRQKTKVYRIGGRAYYSGGDGNGRYYDSIKKILMDRNMIVITAATEAEESGNTPDIKPIDPDILLSSARRYVDLIEYGLGMPLRGIKRLRVLATLLYIECRHSVPRTEREICEFIGIGRTGVAQGDIILRQLMAKNPIDKSVNPIMSLEHTKETLTNVIYHHLAKYSAEGFTDKVHKVVKEADENTIGMTISLENRTFGALCYVDNSFKSIIPSIKWSRFLNLLENYYTE